MTAREINWLRDAYNLIFYYKTSEIIRDRVNFTFIYNNRPVFFYVQTLVQFSPNYFNYYRRIFQHDIGFFSNSKNRQTWKDILPNRLWEFFDKCDSDTGEISKVRQIISGNTSSQQLYSKEEIRRLTQIDNLPNSQQKTSQFEQLVAKISKDNQERLNFVASTNNLADKILYFQKDLQDPLQQIRLVAKGYFTKEEISMVNHYGLHRLSTFKDEATWKETVNRASAQLLKTQTTIKDAKEVLIEESLRNNTTAPKYEKPTFNNQPLLKEEESKEEEQPSAPQMPDERLIRDLIKEERPATPRPPSFIRTTGSRLLGGAGRAGGGLLRAGGGLAARGGAAAAAGAAGAAGGLGAAIAAIGPVIAVVFVGLILGMVLLMAFNNINQTNALFPPYEVAEASSLNPYTGSGDEDISQCKFYRTKGDTQGASYKSNLLLTFFQEASSLTGIPTEVLGAFTRVESPSSVNKTDEDLTIFSDPLIPMLKGGCPRSPTGALGIMQIQPPGTTGHAAPSVAAGAKLIGKTLDTLNEADYCDVRKSVIMGAGFLLQKMGATKWDPAWINDKKAIDALVSGYYGCLIYGGPDPRKCIGPENYGDDVWRSVQACQPLKQQSVAYTPDGGSGVISCPVNSGSLTTGSKEVSGGHCSPSYEKRFPCVKPGQTDYTGRDTAVDIKGTDRKVFLPLVGGEKVTWFIDESGTPIKDHEGGGIAVSANTTTTNGKKYRIRFVHLQSTGLKVNQQAPSATEVGEYNFNANHVHVTLQEDGIYKPADLYFNLCK